MPDWHGRLWRKEHAHIDADMLKVSLLDKTGVFAGLRIQTVYQGDECSGGIGFHRKVGCVCGLDGK